MPDITVLVCRRKCRTRPGYEGINIQRELFEGVLFICKEALVALLESDGAYIRSEQSCLLTIDT